MSLKAQRLLSSIYPDEGRETKVSSLWCVYFLLIIFILHMVKLVGELKNVFVDIMDYSQIIMLNILFELN